MARKLESKDTVEIPTRILFQQSSDRVLTQALFDKDPGSGDYVYFESGSYTVDVLRAAGMSDNQVEALARGKLPKNTVAEKE